MTTTIERMALAISNRHRSNTGASFPLEMCREDARVALEALRDITPALVEAGTEALRANSMDYVVEDDAAICWQAMVEAALKEDKSP